VYVTGQFSSSSITFGSTILPNAGLGDIFLVKYDINGNVLWAKSAGGGYYDAARSVSTNAAGNVYLTGDFDSDFLTFGSTTLTNAGSHDIFIAKLSNNVAANITQNHFNDEIKVFSNPLSSETILQTGNLLHYATLAMDNVFGQTVKQIKNISGQSVTLERDNLPGGLYFIHLTEDNKTIATKKLVITD